jgi:hypothetical protein
MPRRGLFNDRYLKSLLRQPQRQRAADHTAADNGNFGLLDCHGQFSLLENPLSLPDF